MDQLSDYDLRFVQSIYALYHYHIIQSCLDVRSFMHSLNNTREPDYVSKCYSLSLPQKYGLKFSRIELRAGKT